MSVFEVVQDALAAMDDQGPAAAALAWGVGGSARQFERVLLAGALDCLPVFALRNGTVVAVRAMLGRAATACPVVLVDPPTGESVLVSDDPSGLVPALVLDQLRWVPEERWDALRDLHDDGWRQQRRRPGAGKSKHARRTGRTHGNNGPRFASHMPRTDRRASSLTHARCLRWLAGWLSAGWHE